MRTPELLTSARRSCSQATPDVLTGARQSCSQAHAGGAHLAGGEDAGDEAEDGSEDSGAERPGELAVVCLRRVHDETDQHEDRCNDEQLV